MFINFVWSNLSINHTVCSPLFFIFIFFSLKEMSCHFNVFHLQITVLSKNDAKSSDSLVLIWGFPGRPSGKQPACQCRRHKRCGFDH